MPTFAAVFAALYVSHQISDHWLQTDRQATAKGGRGWLARLACARHVTTHSVSNMAVLFALTVWTDWTPSLTQVAIGLAVIAVTHYFADRRNPLEMLAKLTGHTPFWNLGKDQATGKAGCLGTGAYAMDQSWHHLWLGVAALIIA